MRIFICCLLLAFTFACKEKPIAQAPDTTNEHFRYIAYNWYYNDTAKQHDLYIEEYVEAYKTGNFIAAQQPRHQKSPVCFSGTIPDSLWPIIDTAFQSITQTTYLYAPNANVLYCGNTHFLSYRMKNGQEKKVLLVFALAPAPVQRLLLSIENFYKGPPTTPTWSLAVDSIKAAIKALDTTIQQLPLPAPPQLPQNNIRFKTPV